MTTTVQDVLERAAQLIEREGWSQGACSKGGHCILAAVNKARPRQPASMAILDELRHRIGVNSLVGVMNWNDQPGRTLYEVLALLRIPGHCECEMDGDQRAYCASCRLREEQS